jgi:MoxR-like ATPase
MPKVVKVKSEGSVQSAQVAGATIKPKPKASAPSKWKFEWVKNGFKADPSLEHLIKDKPGDVEKQKKFVRRPCHEMIEYEMSMGRNVMIIGPGGVGKDFSIEVISAAQGLPLSVTSCNMSWKVEDALGTDELVPDGKGGTSTIHKPGEPLQVYEKGGITLFSEVNSCPPGELIKLNHAFEAGCLYVERARRTVPKHDHSYLVLNANPAGEQYMGVTGMNKATRNRFRIVYVKAWKKDELLKLLGNITEFDKIAEYYSKCQAAMASDQGRLKGLVSLRDLITMAEDFDKGLPANVVLHTNSLLQFYEEGKKTAYHTALTFAKHLWPSVKDDFGQSVTYK